ncbi:MAG: heparan-alpha-glucosaminide N-acetyltransferase domain-containing protein [Oscillospiraceae bacterium]
MTKETSLPAKQRIWELDALRGLCILCMVAIHAFWDLSAFGGFHL